MAKDDFNIDWSDSDKSLGFDAAKFDWSELDADMGAEASAVDESISEKPALEKTEEDATEVIEPVAEEPTPQHPQEMIKQERLRFGEVKPEQQSMALAARRAEPLKVEMFANARKRMNQDRTKGNKAAFGDEMVASLGAGFDTAIETVNRAVLGVVQANEWQQAELDKETDLIVVSWGKCFNKAAYQRYLVMS